MKPTTLPKKVKLKSPRLSTEDGEADDAAQEGQAEGNDIAYDRVEETEFFYGDDADDDAYGHDD